MSALLDAIGRWYCVRYHTRVSRPVHGEYFCWTCFRRYPVSWATRSSVR